MDVLQCPICLSQVQINHGRKSDYLGHHHGLAGVCEGSGKKLSELRTLVLCPLCRTDITDPIRQFGGKIAICRTCFYDGMEDFVNDVNVLGYVSMGMPLSKAIRQASLDWEPTKDEGFITFVDNLEIKDDHVLLVQKTIL